MVNDEGRTGHETKLYRINFGYDASVSGAGVWHLLLALCCLVIHYIFISLYIKYSRFNENVYSREAYVFNCSFKNC